ncbi:alpha/beta hydrolase [Lactobacillus sp. PV034]|uniref:alpha/beta hydrolase fold domain-containing protein n=1 Tax=Lactobacillus sp. PV034 TaxID=2594495 RepID=UPI00223F9291|nr:alpha/beta hydrolase [Lactobacillus sp. PV034]QNQ80938.1 alpha/beta hydrolase [Lactobacillus sp. PV034]
MVVIKKDIVYDLRHNIKTDIYFPNNTTTETKILVFWHGGGWFRGDKADIKWLGIKLANAGFMTLIPNYRLAPENKFPTAHDDAKAFINWLLKSQYTDENDHDNIVQIGASSGGTLALYLAGLYGFPTVTWSAPVNFSAWIKNHQDVQPSKDAKNELKLQDPKEIRASFYKYFTLTYADSANLTSLDADSYDYSNLRQLFMINSAHELTELSDVLTLIKKLAALDHSIQLLVVKGSRHAMDYANDYLDESLDFLFQALKG